ncbi:DUF6760 family protein [Nitrosomonas sp. PY1]|uniref:DUF6760 family protein n=1 Tax=Nitrosomonas sp. PY1 TaxID=1803906 RepID=UPI0035D4B9E4
MPTLRKRIRRGARQRGGVWRYPLTRLYEEVAYIAYHFHWSHAQIFEFEHRERQQWVNEIAKINHNLNEQSNDDR